MSRPAAYGSYSCYYCGEQADRLLPREVRPGVEVASCGRCRPERGRALPRVGPKMIQSVQVVRALPGRPKAEIARLVGPHGSLGYGWRTIQRCIAAGLIRDGGTPTRAALHCTYLGRSLVTR